MRWLSRKYIIFSESKWANIFPRSVHIKHIHALTMLYNLKSTSNATKLWHDLISQFQRCHRGTIAIFDTFTDLDTISPEWGLISNVWLRTCIRVVPTLKWKLGTIPTSKLSSIDAVGMWRRKRLSHSRSVPISQ